MKYLVLAVILALSLMYVNTASAVENNKFGIHLAQPHDEDIERAAELVNSNGGTWGYITLVIQENDRDIDKWQSIFDKLRNNRLIPIIRIGTQPENGFWRRPEAKDAKEWATFLNKLNWVVEDRYVILFNEPNHAGEWGGEVDPVSFAEVSKAFATELRKADKDYVVMLAGLDTSAPSSMPNYQDAGIFLEKVVSDIGVEEFNSLFDALSSHSYPNPGFVGSPYDTGRRSIRNYEWELQLLTSLGVKELPVFITETGWNGSALPREVVAENFRTAFNTVWLPDDRVVAVTPFVLNYQDEPFLQFSWIKPQNIGVYPEFEAVKGMSKLKGRPKVKEAGTFVFDLPTEIVENSTYHLQISLENKGQAIWSHEEEYSLRLEGIPQTRYLISSIGRIRPFDHRIIDVYITTLDQLGETETQFVLYRGEDVVMKSAPWKFTVVPLPSLDFKVSLFPKVITTEDDFEVQFFDEYEQLVYKVNGLQVINSKGTIDKVENIALNRTYRVVILQKNYLPRQAYIKFKNEGNEVVFEPMLALDFSGDGAFSFNDIGAFFQHPALWRNILPF